MTEELFDVVNDRDQVIGVKTRREVHQLGLMHRAVHILVFNRNGELFLQKRSMLKDSHPGCWDSSASGHVDSGESYDDCALREMQEELGVRVPGGLEVLFKLAAGPQTDHEHVQVFRCVYEGPFTLQPSEIDEGAWCSPARIDEWVTSRPEDFARSFRTIWKRLRSSSFEGIERQKP